MTEQSKNSSESIRRAREIITDYRGPEIRIMEVCGTHTHEIFRQGIRHLLPPAIRLISGPGCPVCVTPAGFIDEAVWLAREQGVTICTFGDLVRVPGSRGSLATARSEGASIQVVYTPLDAVSYAKHHPEKEVAFLSVGFETTTPASCIAVKRAEKLRLWNFTLLTANKTMDQAYLAMADSADAYLYPGHVCAITGTAPLKHLASQGISGVVAGFTAAEILTALAVIARKHREGGPFFANCYPRVVAEDGNPAARNLVHHYMEPCDAEWRGLGIMQKSGMRLKPDYAAFDARRKFSIPEMTGRTNPACRCGEVLQGKCLPKDCPVFASACTPEHPVGACMVSHEGTCSAFYQYDSIAACTGKK